MPLLEELYQLLEAIEGAQTHLDELAAVHRLWERVDQLRHDLILLASNAGHTGGEIGEVTGGVTKEAINKTLRRARRAAA